MPRASGSGKRQQGATSTHRDLRHENGLVSPAKRSSGRKSNGQLDGSARSADHAAGHAGPSSSSFPIPSRCQHNGTLSKNNSDTAIDARPGDALRRASLGTCSEASSESGQSHVGVNGVNGGVIDAGHRQIDVNAMKNVDVHRDSGPLELVATVVKSLPIQDTLAILVILMHVPYMSLSLIYACFALITFVPPVTTKTGMNINLAEILDGNSHTPSLITILCMDFFFFLVWVFLWQPIQDGILEFAKPVIAITLGGGTNAKDGTSRGVTTCFTWILLHQAIRATKSHWGKFTQHFPESWSLPALLSESFESKPVAYDKRSTHGWIQSTLAMHILTQGIVRFVREWYLKREKFNAASGPGDPEVGKSSSLGTSSGSLPHLADSSHDGAVNTVDAEGSTPHPPSSSATATTNKKRRKQSAQVRLQQPLWAALASSKIVAMKEYELSQWAPDSNGPNASDIHNLGSAPFDSQPRQIWISYIGSDEVCFNTSYFPEPTAATEPPQAPTKLNGQADLMHPPGVDASKPFYVRINNAFWQPTRIFPVHETEDSEDDGTRWTGDIYGLRPASTYVCEFVDIQNGEVILATTIRTVKETLRVNDPLSPVFPPGQQPLRPDSPATIIRNSIAAEEARLADERARLKTWRKESKTKMNAIKKDNEAVDNLLASAGNSDEKHKQKIRQNETQKVQAERDTESLGEQLNNFDSAPGLSDRKKKLDKVYSAEKKLFDIAQKQFKEYKSNLDRKVNAKELEKVNLNSRRNKIGLRIDKVEKESRNIADANIRGLDEAERRRQERVVWLDNCASIESNYKDRITQAFNTNAALSEHIQHVQAQMQSFSQFMTSAANGMPMDIPVGGAPGEPGLPAFRQQPSTWDSNPAILPQYPAGMWAGSSGDLMPSVTAPSTQPGQTWLPPPTATPFEPQGIKSRGRSSSMLSDVSGFTEPSGDEDSSKSPAGGFYRPAMDCSGRNGNGTSGSSGSTGSGSIGEPASPR
ncbi:hypothetical protein QQS21_008104 [Conoideocrella luteorostrata]|uniref:Ubiquitination network signaling protein n=1 Tax=Conoideocrella luteorostrata TaxID=1105319 RepID=A0AAJ0FYX9_9HYPO|nr:hypothetical protein QQS21_008104 [Conoideocrella luteorostrata]